MVVLGGVRFLMSEVLLYPAAEAGRSVPIHFQTNNVHLLLVIKSVSSEYRGTSCLAHEKTLPPRTLQ